jgi:ubiquitin-activating enzyme E1 C
MDAAAPSKPHLSSRGCLSSLLADIQHLHQLPFVDAADVLSRGLNSPILVLGAGGLGCEILKNLALTGFSQLHVVDMDTIELTNLNRQFLFREGDIGKPKAEVAAAAISRLRPDVTVTPHCCRLETLPAEFYQSLRCVISGLDSFEPRAWVSALLVDIYQQSGVLIPLIDGASEGFKGSVRVILPGISPCFECTRESLATDDRAVYPVCTLANRPRRPEHVVQYVSQFLWAEQEPFGADTALDADNPAHVDWLMRRSLERAAAFAIQGVTRSFALGVVKNIVHAIASTNAVVAGLLTAEAVKLLTVTGPPLNNFRFYSGSEGAGSYVIAFQKNPACPVCREPRRLSLQAPGPQQYARACLSSSPHASLSTPNSEPTPALTTTVSELPIACWLISAVTAAIFEQLPFFPPPRFDQELRRTLPYVIAAAEAYSDFRSPDPSDAVGSPVTPATVCFTSAMESPAATPGSLETYGVALGAVALVAGDQTLLMVNHSMPCVPLSPDCPLRCPVGKVLAVGTTVALTITLNKTAVFDALPEGELETFSSWFAGHNQHSLRLLYLVSE